MIKNYFLTTIHTLRQNPLYTALSVFGIALTFVFACILFLISQAISGDYQSPGYADRTWVVRWLSNDKQEYRAITSEFYKHYVVEMKTPEAIAITNPGHVTNIEINGLLNMLALAYVDGDYFEGCRFNFLEGRAISKNEMAENRPVIVIDHYTAQKSFRGESAIGKKITIKGRDFEIIGVVDNRSFFTTDMYLFNLWAPLSFAPNTLSFSLLLTARDNASLPQVREEFEQLLKKCSDAEGNRVQVGEADMLSQQNQLAFWSHFTAWGGILLLLFIPALNILSLNISKSYNRSEETAIRKVFGASRSTIFGQLLMETMLLTTAGAVVGISVTPLIMQAIDNVLLRTMLIPLSFSFRFDIVALTLFIIPCIAVFGFLSGSISAWYISKQNITHILKGETA